MGKDQTIDELLKNSYSTISLGYTGIYEATKLIKGVSHTQKHGKEFAMKIMQYLKKTVDRWKRETGLGFVLYGTQENIQQKFVKIDKEKYGVIPGITDKEHYTNSYHIPEDEEIDIFEKLKFEGEFQKISSGGGIIYVNIDEDNKNKLKEIISFIYDNIQYVKILHSMS